MLNTFTNINTIEEIASIILENWNNNDLESFSDSDINKLKKYFLKINLLSLAKRMTPLDSFTYLHFRLNFSRLVLSQISDKSNAIYLKLKFAIWHYSVEKKIRIFLIKAKNNETIQKKLNQLLLSLKSLGNFNKSISRRDLSSKFMILSDLTSQLGYFMFSLISIKKSVKNDPDSVDAILFLGKAHLELGNALSKNAIKNKIGKQRQGELQYNFDKSKTILNSTLDKIKDINSKTYISNLINSVDSVLDEIKLQRKSGKNTVVQVAVEQFIGKNLEKIEELITSNFATNKNNLKFPSNIIQQDNTDEKKKLDSQTKRKEYSRKAENDDTLTIISDPRHIVESSNEKKPGKLFDVYSKNNNTNYDDKDTLKISKNETKVQKHGRIKSDSIGYKLELEKKLKQTINEKNSNNRKSNK